MSEFKSNIRETSEPAAAWLAGAAPFFYELDTSLTLVHLAVIAVLASALFCLERLRNKLKRRSEAFRRREGHFRLIGNDLPNVATFQLTCSEDNEFSFTQLSRGCERILGLDEAQIMQDAYLVFDHVYEADLPALQAAYEQANKKLTPVGLEIRILDVSGALKWLHISAVPHRENNAIVWDGFVLDISVNKQTESLLLEEMQNFKNLFETIDDFLLIFDMDGKLIHTNPAVEKQLGYSSQVLKSMSIFELFPKPSREEAYQMVARLQTERAAVFNLPLQASDGSIVQMETNIFQGSWKNQQAIFGVARDISSHRKTEEALRESQQMLQLIIDTIPMSVFWKDNNSVYQGCNQKFIRECNLDRLDEVVGKSPVDLFEESIAIGIIGRDKQVLTTNQPLFNEQYSHAQANGNMGWRNASIIPLRNPAGEADGVLGVWFDITEQTIAEERLRRTLEDMERFNQLMRGRERRTLELKGEVNRLLEELGRSKKYKTTSGNRP